MGIIKSWSYSRKKLFDTCPYILHHNQVLKSKKKDQPADSPLVRGLDLHKKAELYIAEKLPLPNEFEEMRETFERLRKEAYDRGEYETEENVCFDENWALTDWYAKNAWLRVSFDLQIGLTGEFTHIVDWKTGKKDGNELPHLLQGQLYAVAAVARNPKLEAVQIDFVYLDHNKTTSKIWKRPMIDKKHITWDKIGRSITEAEKLPPTPSKFGCKFCDYNEVCNYSIQEGDV